MTIPTSSPTLTRTYGFYLGRSLHDSTNPDPVVNEAANQAALRVFRILDPRDVSAAQPASEECKTPVNPKEFTERRAGGS